MIEFAVIAFVVAGFSFGALPIVVVHLIDAVIYDEDAD